MSALRAMVVGEIATHKDCWIFRRKLAKLIGCCVRTVQRAITQAKESGLLGVHRCKKGEIPPRKPEDPRAGKPVDCGWSHRFWSGRGKAGPALAAAVAAARAKWLTRTVMRASSETPLPKRAAPPKRTKYVPRPSRTFTAAEIDAELERMPSAPPSSRDGPD